MPKHIHSSDCLISYNLLFPTFKYLTINADFSLHLSHLQKPTVFLFKDVEKLADVQGYAADIVQEIQQRLNFTDVLVPNTGFGAYRNGSWNGMVGDLLYGVSGGYMNMLLI